MVGITCAHGRSLLAAQVAEWEAQNKELRSRLRKAIWRVTREAVEGSSSPVFIDPETRQSARAACSLSFKDADGCWRLARNVVQDRILDMFDGVFAPGVLDSMCVCVSAETLDVRTVADIALFVAFAQCSWHD